MKTPSVVAIVVGVHVVVIGGFLLIQGCGTTRAPEPSPEQPKLPEVAVPAPTPVSPPLPLVAETPAPAEKTYVVEKGDSLSLIAKRFGVSQAEIMAMNNLQDPNKLRVGQPLKLPGYVNLNAPRPKASEKKASAAKTAVAATPEDARAKTVGQEYVVQKGDSLSVIAAKHGTTVAALRAANGLKGDKIMVGQKLLIPVGKGGTAATAKQSQAAPASRGAGTPAVSAATVPEARPAVEGVQQPMPAGAEVLPTAPGSRVLEHTVAPGEDLKTVAYMYSVDPNELKRINGLQDDSVLTPGQRLKIPLAE